VCLLRVLASRYGPHDGSAVLNCFPWTAGLICGVSLGAYLHLFNFVHHIVLFTIYLKLLFSCLFSRNTFYQCILLISGCTFNTYGENCKIPCGHCKDNVSCNSINGSCPEGCTEGWYGEKCDIGKFVTVSLIFFFLRDAILCEIPR
jgi:hypothetical protein